MLGTLHFSLPSPISTSNKQPKRNTARVSHSDPLLSCHQLRRRLTLRPHPWLSSAASLKQSRESPASSAPGCTQVCPLLATSPSRPPSSLTHVGTVAPHCSLPTLLLPPRSPCKQLPHQSHVALPLRSFQGVPTAGRMSPPHAAGPCDLGLSALPALCWLQHHPLSVPKTHRVLPSGASDSRLLPPGRFCPVPVSSRCPFAPSGLSPITRSSAPSLTQQPGGSPHPLPPPFHLFPS